MELTSEMKSTPAGIGHRDTETVELPVGIAVEVRRRFDRAWARGFAIAETGPGCYRVRRLSDGVVLPVWFPAEEIRPTP